MAGFTLRPRTLNAIPKFQLKPETPRLFRGIRICGTAFPLALLAVSFPLSASANSSFDDLDCITAYSVVAEEPLQVADNSGDLPNDPERGISVLADKANIPSRSDQGLTQFPSSTGFEVAALRALGNAPLLSLRTHFSSSLNEHIRERAPPEPILV